MTRYFNIEYSGGQYHLFINGVLSKSTESDVVEDELKTWIDDINRGVESQSRRIVTGASSETMHSEAPPNTHLKMGSMTKIADE